jgi:hypothetical protein
VEGARRGRKGRVAGVQQQILDRHIRVGSGGIVSAALVERGIIGRSPPRCSFLRKPPVTGRWIQLAPTFQFPEAALVHPEVTSAALTGAGGGEGRHTFGSNSTRLRTGRSR